MAYWGNKLQILKMFDTLAPGHDNTQEGLSHVRLLVCTCEGQCSADVYMRHDYPLVVLI